MNLKFFSHKISHLFRRAPEAELPEPVVEELIRSLEKTHEEECDCGELHSFLDQYAELKVRGEDAARLMPLIRDHLEMCHECCEEYEALLSVLQATSTQEQ